MTHAEAYIELCRLEYYHFNRWDMLKLPRTKYQKMIVARKARLWTYASGQSNEAPEEEAEWLKKLPPCDVEETVENWFRNQYCMAKDKNAWKIMFERMHGEPKPFNPEVPEHILERDRKETGK